MDPELPSEKELGKFANWGFITIGALLIAAFVPMGPSKLLPLSLIAAMTVFGVLMIPALICFGATARHAARSLGLRQGEQREGRITYTNSIGRFIGQHSYLVACIVIGGSLVVAAVWTALGH